MTKTSLKPTQKLWIIADRETRTIQGTSFSRSMAREYKLPTDVVFDVPLTAAQLKTIASKLNSL